jgi:hypothetical protein
MLIKHPAIYSDNFIPVFAKLLINSRNVLDIFAGIGKIGLIKEYGYTGKITCNELEREWADSSLYNIDKWHIGDAANMEWSADNNFDAICTSPTYGNRMADHHNAKDNSKRITYKHYLGRDLNEENTGMMQWGTNYKNKHIEIYKECLRVLCKNGLFIINISDHIRKGELINVSEWHKETLINIGFIFIEEIKCETKRMKYGKNSELRAKYEYIYVFKVA